MSKDATYQLKELSTLHGRVLSVFVLMFVLTFAILVYMALRVYVLPECITPIDFASLCSFALACAVLSTGQLGCLRRMRHSTGGKLEAMVFVDELTGVYNYRYLKQRLDEELERARRHGFPVSLICLDCDKFKLVNDTFGHEAGNAALRLIARTVQRCCRGEDLVGRMGGDEFLVILPQTDAAGATVAAERIKSHLDAADLASSDGQPFDFLSFSLGVASYPADARTRRALVRAADEAMYGAKRAGGDRVAL